MRRRCQGQPFVWKDEGDVPAAQSFAYEERVPDAQSAFGLDLSPPDVTANSTLVFVDTSALLALYDATEAALRVLRRLRDEGRLVVPGHVAREFAVVRSYKVTDLYDALVQETSRSVVLEGPSELPNQALVESLGYADQLGELRQQIAVLVEAYQHAAAGLMDKIESWAGDDFISTAYGKLFDDEVVQDLEAEFEGTMDELQRRDDLSRPPGYLDSDKDQNAAGDLLIWKTVLRVAARRDCDAVLVTEDRKPDWWCQGGRGTALFPRTKLIHEFDQETGGRSFGLQTPAGFLDEMSVGGAHVQHVRRSPSSAPTETVEIVGPEGRVETVVRVAEQAYDTTMIDGGCLGDRRAASLAVDEQEAEGIERLARAAGVDVTRDADGRIARTFGRHETDPTTDGDANDGTPERWRDRRHSGAHSPRRLPLANHRAYDAAVPDARREPQTNRPPHPRSFGTGMQVSTAPVRT